MKYLIFLFTLLLAFPAYAVDTLSITDSTGGTITTVRYVWTSDGSGNAIGVTAEEVPGVLYSAVTSVSSAAQPSNNYDIVVYQQFDDADSTTDNIDATDLFEGALENRPNTLSAVQNIRRWPDTVKTVSGKLRIVISNAGAAKKGVVDILVARNLRIQQGDASVPMTSGATGQILQYRNAGRAKYVTMSGEATIADEGAVTLQGNPDFTSVTTGVADTTNGSFIANGRNDTLGGLYRIHNGADVDGTIDYYDLRPDVSGNLTFRSYSPSFVLQKTWTFETDGDTALPGNLATTGSINVAGSGAISSLTSDSWTPTLGGLSNVASTGSPSGFYQRVGNIVTGVLYMQVTPTTGSNTATSVSVTLPVASNFTANEDAIGAGSARRSDTSYTPGYLRGDGTSDYFVFVFGSIDTGTHVIRSPFSYIVK